MELKYNWMTISETGKQYQKFSGTVDGFADEIAQTARQLRSMDGIRDELIQESELIRQDAAELKSIASCLNQVSEIYCNADRIVRESENQLMHESTAAVADRQQSASVSMVTASSLVTESWLNDYVNKENL